MRRFTDLWRRLQATDAPREALADYLAAVPAVDLPTALALLLGWRPRRLIDTAGLRRLAREASGLPDWLYQRCEQETRDACETAALLAATAPTADPTPLWTWLEELSAAHADPSEARAAWLAEAWRRLGPDEALLLNKLATATLRLKLRPAEIAEAWADATGQPAADLAYRLGTLAQPTPDACVGALASAAPAAARHLGFAQPAASHHADAGGWLAQWHWGGVRIQVLRRSERCLLWSAEGDLVEAPALAAAARALPPDTVLEGQWLVPDRLHVHDLLEWQGESLVDHPLRERLARLAALSLPTPFALTPTAADPALVELDAAARAAGAQGLWLRDPDAPHHPGAGWLQWQPARHRLRATLVYAQLGGDPRVPPELTFAVRDAGKLAPVARLGLPLGEAARELLHGWVRERTIERFGPVRAVEPGLLFELGLSGVTRSRRHKCGLRLHEVRLLADPVIADPMEVDRLALLWSWLRAD